MTQASLSFTTWKQLIFLKIIYLFVFSCSSGNIRNGVESLEQNWFDWTATVNDPQLQKTSEDFD